MRLQRLVRPSTAPPGEQHLLVLLHGLGSDEKDLFSFSSQLDSRLVVVSLRAPGKHLYGGYRWFDLDIRGGKAECDIREATANLEILKEEGAQLQVEHSIAAERTIWGGFSQGAIMTLALGLARPDLMGGLLLLSGATLPELTPKTSPGFEGMQVLVQHGLYDTTLPLALGRQVAEACTRFGGVTQYMEYPMGHGVSQESLNGVDEWLNARLQPAG